MHYSIRWERISSNKNILQIRTTFLDEQGTEHAETKFYEGWIGVCTQSIDRVVQAIRHHFPGHNVVYQYISNAKKILPYFEDRIAKGKLDYRSKPFYKIYSTACIKNIGRFFNRYKFSYYDPEDWRVRLYIDLCTRYNCLSFYYKWYTIHSSSLNLIEAYQMVPERKDLPDWRFAAFDLESVPLVGNHIPMGHLPTDRIVMMSLFKWNRHTSERFILYVLPEGIENPLPDYPHGFKTESELLIRFHELLEDAQVLTGYNINAFDFPCIFARLVWLKLYSVLGHYGSSNVGKDLVVSYRQKITLDLYAYFKTFSGYNLPSFKLDDVAHIKLNVGKLPVKATGIWTWYRYPRLPRSLLEATSQEYCFQIMRPETVTRASEYGTFTMYLDYCLKDSELVHLLLEKELVLSFLVERANFTALSAVEALHLGNSRYLLELFKTYGTRLGYFIHPKFFVAHDAKNQSLLGQQKTYQGALNFCYPERVYEDVAVMDFASMYPSTLLSSNLCYGSCTIMTRDEWLATPAVHRFQSIPYRQHSGQDFEQNLAPETQFSYPPFNPDHDPWVIVINRQAEAFLPQIVAHFIRMRQFHQREWKTTKDVYHYNVQLGIKILINSLYGVMANKDSPLAYLPIAMIIVTLSRYQLLGSYHYLKHRGYEVCYADTDSLMVCEWPEEHCDAVNAFLGLPNVELKFEQRMKRLLVLSKKRYVYERGDGLRVTKGFQKKTNGLINYMTQEILERVWSALFQRETTPHPVSLASRGWILWVDVLLEANYRCRDPKKYSIYRKIKKLDQYVSASCPAVKYLQKYPDRTDEHVEFTYSRADVASTEAAQWVVDVEDCVSVDYEKLFISQKKIFCTLINLAFWHYPDPTAPADQVLNALHWKRFVHAELLHWHATGRRLLLLVEPSVKYTFCVNDHITQARRPGRRKKVELGLDDF